MQTQEPPPYPVPKPIPEPRIEQVESRERASDGTVFTVGEKVNLGASLEWDDFDWVNHDGLRILEFVNGNARLELLEQPHPLEMLQKRVQVEV